MLNLYIAGDVYQCRATVRHTGSGRILDEVFGDHLSGGKSNADVEHLSLWNQNMNFIPLGIGSIFPAIKAISWYNSKLLTISADDLQQFPNLIFLGLWMNNLVTLDGDLFKFTPTLQLIDFDGNQIENVGRNLLSDLKNLTVADFSSNFCIDAFAYKAEDIPGLIVKLEDQCSTYDVDSTTAETSTGETSTVETSTRVVDCSATCVFETSSIIPHISDCTRYIVCQDGWTFIRFCPEGQIFDINTWQCGDIATSVCAACD